MKDHFERFLGLGNATDSELDILAYSYDGSELSGKARVVLFPSQDEQLRLILTYCNRSNIDIVVRGNGTSPVGGAVPDNSIVLVTQGFDRVHALNLREGWVKVDCGVTIAQLNDALAEHGMRFPLEPFSAATTTVGGFLAVNGTSRHGLRYGRAKDLLVELEIMDGTGKLVTTQKDLDDYVGWEGSNIIIVRAKLKIVPLEPRSADLLFFDTLSQAIQRSFELVEDKDRPLALDYLDPAAATFAGINTKHTLIVEWESERGAIKHEAYGGLIAKRAATRRRLGEQGYIFFEDSELPAGAREQAIRWCAEKDLPIVAHLGQGIIHPFFKQEQEALRVKWLDYVQQAGGSVSGQFGYGRKKKAYFPQERKTRARQLKERLDYNNVLSRGKVYDFI